MKSIIFIAILSLLAINSQAQRNAIRSTTRATAPVDATVRSTIRTTAPSAAAATVKMERPVPKAVGAPIEIKNLASKQYQKEFDKLVAQGYQPTKEEVKRQQVIDYTDGETPQIAYWATFQKFENGYEWIARHALSAQAYQKEFETWVAQGYVPISIGVGATDGDETYAIIFQKIPNAPQWVARHGLTLADLSAQSQGFLQQGYKLKTKVSCIRKGVTIYAAIWSK